MSPDFSQPLEKGKKLTPQYVDAHIEEFKLMGEYFINYPDLFLDWITPRESNFRLFPYQRIFLRAMMRYQYLYVVACRAFSKSFITILGAILRCIFLPGEKYFIAAPGKGQGAKIATEKINEIFSRYPLLKLEVESDTYANDNVQIKFKNGSIFDVVRARDSTRGGRRHGGIIDEVRDHDGDQLNSVVIPLLNVARREPDGTLDPTESNQQQVYITSASSKASYAYDKLIELFEQSIIDPSSTFVMGCDYRIPMMHGLLNAEMINKIKMDTTVKEETFAQEYLSLN